MIVTMLFNLTDLSEYWLSMGDPSVLAFGVILFCVVISGILLRMGVSRMAQGQKRMSKLQREAFEDALLDALDAAVVKGGMSKKSVKYWSARFAQDYGFSGLVFRGRVIKKLHQFKADLLKSKIKLRLANGEYKNQCPLPQDQGPPWEDGKLTTKAKFQAKFRIKTA